MRSDLVRDYDLHRNLLYVWGVLANRKSHERLSIITAALSPKANPQPEPWDMSQWLTNLKLVVFFYESQWPSQVDGPPFAGFGHLANQQVDFERETNDSRKRLPLKYLRK